MHLAGAQQPLVDLAREMPRHQRSVAVKEQAVGLRAIAPADDVDVARAAGDDKPGSCPRPFDQRVDGNGRAMDQLVDYSGGESALADAIDDALLQLCRRGEALCLNEAPAAFVQSHPV